MAGVPAAPAPTMPNGAPPAPNGATPNPLSAPVAPPPPPPVGNAAPAPLAMPPGTVSAPVAPPPNHANGHPMPTHYQHQSQQAMASAPQPLQQQQRLPVQGMQHQPPPPAVNGQPPPQQQVARPPQPMQHPQLQQQQVQAQAQQQRPQPLNGGWQSDKDVDDRRKMIAKIVQLLRQRKPNAPQEWLNKLPQMAKRLEESLYRSAPSFDAYNDISTLKQRLQQLAMNIGMKTKRMHQQQQAAQQQQVQQPGVPVQPQQQPQYQQQRIQQQQPPPQQQQVVAQRQPGAINGAMPPQQQQQGVPLQQPHLTQQPQQQQPQQRQMVNMSDINPSMAPNQQQQARAPAAAMSQSNYAVPPPQGGMAPAPPQLQQAAPVAAPAAAAAAASGTTATRQPSDRQQVLRHQQQRLLLLRHAAKCPHQDNQCPVTPHCAGMKRLWKHIAECKDQKCLVPHCVSSRYVLSHYHRCKDVRCPVCGPVREAIHRSHEKQKQMQALKQGHQQALKQNALPGSGGAAGGAPAAVVGGTGAPPTKRQKTSNGQYVTSQVPPQQQPGQPYPPHAQQQPQQPQYAQQQPPRVQQPYQQQQPQQAQQPAQAYTQQPLAQPSSQHPGAASSSQMVVASTPPTQPINPNMKGGYVYSHPPKPTSSSSQPAAAVGAAPSQKALSNGKVLGNSLATSGPKPQEDHTLINCFTLAEIETHIKSLDQGLVLPVAKLKTKFGDVLKGLQAHSHGWVFNSPVDPVELGLPDYFEVIEKPMDLGTVKKQLENGVYRSLKEVDRDVNLTFDNAMLYNPEGSVVWNMASELKVKFSQDYEVLLKQLHAEEEVKRKNGDACSLCGCEKLLFEPPVFYCNGLNCRSKRIRRNSYFYVGGNNQFHWCQPCYDDLKESKPIEMADVTLRKSQLDKKKNSEIPEESWVQCDRCERWIHQICALFNTRQNTDTRSEFVCPSCTIVDRKKKKSLGPTSQTPMAEDLPRTRLSEQLEKHVREKLKIKMAEMSKEKAETLNIPLEQATKLVTEGGGEIYIRQVTSMSRTLDVRPRMKKRYSFKEYPSEFKYRCKCIIVFQNLDGVDVILFGLYVYEHDETNAPPNQRSVYVSYLDSVHYMRPRKMRTFVYHELLASYLDYVRCKGYNTAHIWACPPLKGDDYILFAKPEDQKIPKDDRLRMWYIDMLKDCQRRGIVGKMTNAYDMYFANEKNDATVLPYMEGDYFPAEMENIIKDMEEGKNLSKKPDKAGKKGKKEKKKKSKAGARGGTRSSGLDKEALSASGIVPEGVDIKSLKEGGKDWVMKKLGETINPMKDSFIVAYLNWEGQSKENQVVPKEVADYREKHGIVAKILGSSAMKEEEGKDSKPSAAAAGGEPKKENGTDVAAAPSTPAKDHVTADESAAKDSKPAAADEKKEGADEDSKKLSTPIVSMDVQVKKEPVDDEEKKESTESDKAKGAEAGENSANPDGKTTEPSIKKEGKDEVEAGNAAADEKKPGSPSTDVRAGKFAAMAKRKKKDVETSPPVPDKPESAKSAEVPSKSVTKDSKGRLVKVIDDDDEEMDCEFLNNRQLFLNLCQGNHYQFDSLRRAKHTSMMVLWHLHNRDAPKFVQQCALCSREILQGKRYHCPTCADFDQCIECLRNPAIPNHPHPLQAIPIGNQQSSLTPEQRKERKRSIALHMTLLLHASTCRSAKCTSANCAKMKGLLKHGAGCKVKANGGCTICKRIWALLQIHARQCKTENCPVPNCMAIRERYRQLQLQQQAMDDRRRQMMNQTYHQQAR